MRSFPSFAYQNSTLCCRSFNPVSLALICLTVCLLTVSAAGETAESVLENKVTRANFRLAEDWSVSRQFDRTSNLWTVPQWVENDMFYYRYSTTDETVYYLVDASAKTRKELFDRQKLAEELREIEGKEFDWKKLPISNVELTSDKSTLTFSVNTRKFRYDLRNNLLQLCDSLSESISADLVSTSPDDRMAIVLRDHNLFLLTSENDSDSLIQITDDGAEHNDGYEIVWSPDSRHFAILREDWTQVEDLWLIDPLSNPRPTLETFKWPMPGEDVEQYSLWTYNCDSGKLVEMETARWVDQTLFQIEWSPDSEKLYFLRLSRDWLKLDLCLADPLSGKTDILIEEHGFRQFYYTIRPPFRILQSTGDLIWWSWIDNWGHYYLYAANGKLKAKVTDGSFNSGKIVFCDEDNRVQYFMGNARENGRNPYNHYLYRVNLDGSDLRILTPENAGHEIYMSDSGNYFVDNYSRPDLKPHAVVRDNLGNLIIELEASDISELEDAGWQKPDIFRALAADDSTELWGVLFKPFDFDSSMKYPTIVYAYPGKETEFIPLRFYNNNWVTAVSTALAQYGFIVAVFGNRGGTIERSYEYYNYGWDDLRDYPIADKKYVMQQLAKRHKFIDLDRIGVMGSSSGGFFAASAILTEPDFFKVAVSKSGNHDNNIYYHHWNERYGKVTEIVNGEGHTIFNSKSPTNNEIAGNLKGRLLLVQGDMDHYVHPSLTSRLANDLIKANKRFDQFIVPGEDHFFGTNWQYLIRYIELYFVENLMGDRRWSVDLFENMDTTASQ